MLIPILSKSFNPAMICSRTHPHIQLSPAIFTGNCEGQRGKWCCHGSQHAPQSLSLSVSQSCHQPLQDSCWRSGRHLLPVPSSQAAVVTGSCASAFTVVLNYEKANYIWLNKVFHTPQQQVYSNNVNQVELWVQRRYDCVEPSGEQSSYCVASESPCTLHV